MQFTSTCDYFIASDTCSVVTNGASDRSDPLNAKNCSLWTSLFLNYYPVFTFYFIQWTVFHFYFIAFYYCKPLVTVCLSSMIDWSIRMYRRTVYFIECRVKLLVPPCQREPSCRKTRDVVVQVVLSRPHSSYPYAFTRHNVQKYVRFMC